MVYLPLQILAQAPRQMDPSEVGAALLVVGSASCHARELPVDSSAACACVELNSGLTLHLYVAVMQSITALHPPTHAPRRWRAVEPAQGGDRAAQLRLNFG